MPPTKGKRPMRVASAGDAPSVVTRGIERLSPFNATAMASETARVRKAA
jgi:hypothetical protein